MFCGSALSRADAFQPDRQRNYYYRDLYNRDTNLINAPYACIVCTGHYTTVLLASSTTSADSLQTTKYDLYAIINSNLFYCNNALTTMYIAMLHNYYTITNHNLLLLN